MAQVNVEQCSICAWRATCAKRFSVSGREMRCPDFTRDLTIAQANPDPAGQGKDPK